MSKDPTVEELVHKWRYEASCESRFMTGIDETLAVCAAELEAALKREGWQPIETAPVGEHVLVYYPIVEDGHIEDAYIYDDGDGKYAVLFDGDSLGTDPTFWMPLPKPPQESEG